MVIQSTENEPVCISATAGPPDELMHSTTADISSENNPMRSTCESADDENTSIESNRTANAGPPLAEDLLNDNPNNVDRGHGLVPAHGDISINPNRQQPNQVAGNVDHGEYFNVQIS